MTTNQLKKKLYPKSPFTDIPIVFISALTNKESLMQLKFQWR